MSSPRGEASDQGPTVQQAVAEHFKASIASGTYLPCDNNDRLFGHDVLHAMLGVDGGGLSEEVVGIYQAVMLGDIVVNKRRKSWRDEGRDISLQDIREVIMPGVRKYIEDVTDRPWQKELPPEQVAEHYRKAVLLRRLFYAQFERNMGDIPTSELRTMRFEPFRDVVENMQHAYSIHYHGVSPTAYQAR